MLKIKITKNKVIVFLSLLLITTCIFIKINTIYTAKKEKQKEDKKINEVIKNEEKETVSSSLEPFNEETKTNNSNNYVAVLEIPKIRLNKGLVMATKNFKSINYAISIDRHSKMPDQNGNFILYAHSGNSKIAYFKNLKDLNIDDEIKVYYEGNIYSYKVIKKYTVPKDGYLSVNNDNENKYITLTTCSQENKKEQIVIIGEID